MRPKGSKLELEARRMRAMKMLLEGMRPVEVAARVGVTDGAISQWKKAYERAGMAGLKAKRHPGRKPKLGRAELARLGELLLKGPRAHGFGTDLWTLPRVAAVIVREFGVRHHPGHVWRILRKMGWRCRTPERCRPRGHRALAHAGLAEDKKTRRKRVKRSFS